MILRVVGVAALVPLAVVVGSCAEPTPESCKLNYTATGAAVGAVSGAAMGAAIAALAHASGGGVAAAALGGALVGTMIGVIAGQQQDKACHDLALRQALDRAVALNATTDPPVPTSSSRSTAVAVPARSSSEPQYQSVAWANQMTKNSGNITPIGKVTTTGDDQVCMTYADQQIVNGETKTVTGKACRRTDGEWIPTS
jgi:surface antigen